MSFSLNRFKTDQTGQVVVLFALMLVPICTVCGFCLDYQTKLQRVQKVQAVLDAAVLAAARVKQAGETEAVTKASIATFLSPQIEDLGGLACDTPIVTLTADGQILAKIDCAQTTSLMQLVGAEEMLFHVEAASHYSIGRLDAAFIFDASDSMNSDNRLPDLKIAAKEAVDLLLPSGAPAEAIEHTRLAMASYSTLLNAGPYFEHVTDTTPTRTYYHTTETALTDADLAPGDLLGDLFIGLYDADNGDLIAELGNNAVIRVENSELDDMAIAVTLNSSHSLFDKVESMRLELSGEESADKAEDVPPYSLYGDSGIADLDGERWQSGDYTLRVRAYEENGLSGLKVFDEELDFQLFIDGDTTTASQSYTLTSTCVWEREGADAFTDAPPGPGNYFAYQQAWFEEDAALPLGGKWFVGFNTFGERRITTEVCATKSPLELTNDRTKLINYISALTTDDATAGHLGIAWSWYLISDRWNALFDGDAEPVAFTDPDTTKAIVLMTDGNFNFFGHMTLGSSPQQARALCDNIKLKDVSIYAVAFKAPVSGQRVLKYCASDPGYYFNAQNADDLKKAYKEIALSLSDLRLSQ